MHELGVMGEEQASESRAYIQGWSSKDLHDPQDAHLVRRARQIRPRKWPLTVKRDERRASTQHAEKSNHSNP
jgi:hypothetical protein